MPVSQRSICVFCGSREGQNPTYAEAAQTLGQSMGERGWRLVYGAGDIGIMGIVADATINTGAKTFGVIPEHLQEREVGKQNLDTLIVTETMHERKKLMFTNSDAIVLMPGGAGSLDEFFEVLTWAQLGLHEKPIIVVNVQEYWTPLIALVDHVIAQGFADPSLRALFEIHDTVEATIARLAKLL